MAPTKVHSNHVAQNSKNILVYIVIALQNERMGFVNIVVIAMWLLSLVRECCGFVGYNVYVVWRKCGCPVKSIFY